MAGNGKMKRRPIRRQVQRMVLVLCVAALVLVLAVGFVQSRT